MPQQFGNFVWAALLCLVALPAAGQQRAYRIDDWFSMEELVTPSVAFAPDGQAVVFTKLRAANTQISNHLILGETRGDIWLQEALGRPARNLTNGLADSSGWWAPQWSPDGQQLAFLSSRGGNVRVWGWERARQQVRQLSTSGVDFSDNGGCRWIDSRRLLCLALQENETSTPSHYNGRAVERAEAAWAKAKRGELTASVVDSRQFKLPQRRLIVVDLASGTTQTLATTQSMDSFGWAQNWWLSPTAQAVAFARPVPATKSARQRATMGFPAEVDLRRLDGRPLRLNQALPANVITSTLKWSPDGESLAFFALGDAVVHPELLFGDGAREVRSPTADSKEYPGHLWRVDLATGRVDQLRTGDIDLGRGATPPSFLWTSAGELLFHAPRLLQGVRPFTAADPEWIMLARDGRTRSLATGGQRLPTSLEPIDGGAAFLGLMDGDVWRVDPIKGTARNLTVAFEPRVNSLETVSGANATTHLVLSSVRPPRTAWEQMRVSQGRQVEYLSDFYLLDLASGTAVPLPPPAPRAAAVAYDGASRSAVWHAEDRHGTFLWRTSGASPAELLVATNTFFKDVAKGEQRTIEYTTMNGERMKAKLVLPVGYQPGRRYPMVVDHDIGYTEEGSSHYAARDPSVLPSPYEEEWAAGGYVYMFTSWPSTSMDPIGRGNLLLGPNGVVPAVERAIALGIADPDRLFLYGASSAGYGVFALITQTSRFKAAVAEAGWADQISSNLTTIIHDRYGENPFDLVYMGAAYNRSQLPFWRNAENYRRNSPLSYVDRVQTPLMILHGDVDPVSITQPEIFFKALVMQRKPAEFVRYWGEGHGNRTPANYRDGYQRMFAWFDRWGDIARDAAGNMLFEGDRVQSRKGAPPLPPEAYAKLPLFGPGGPAASRAAAARPAGAAR